MTWEPKNKTDDDDDALVSDSDDKDKDDDDKRDETGTTELYIFIVNTDYLNVLESLKKKKWRFLLLWYSKSSL